MKIWECVKVGNHRDIGSTIDQWQKNGWELHTYQAQGTPTIVNHYLLFMKQTEKKHKSLEEIAEEIDVTKKKKTIVVAH